jgi:hypothetical protein
VGRILEALSAYDRNDMVTFGSSIDGIALEFEEAKKIVSINFSQTGKMIKA